MIISYVRSSSLNSFYFCQQQYFLDYVLGIKQEPNKKTIVGSMAHRVFEILGKAKLYTKYNDELIGEVDVNNLNYENIINSCYNHFVERYPKLEFNNTDIKLYRQSIDTVLADVNFNPLNRKIVSVEEKFDFSLKKPWAKYRYTKEETPEGIGEIEGYLSLKGTIDLVTEIDKNTIEIIDWKTGKRFDWGKKVVKDYTYLLQDKQLMLYYYAANLLYPNIENIIFTIYFINDGGPYTVPFSKTDLMKTEGLLRETYQKIKSTLEPELHKSWHCSKFCFFGKHNIHRQKTNKSDETICQIIHDEIKLKGMNQVVNDYTLNDFDIGSYDRG